MHAHQHILSGRFRLTLLAAALLYLFGAVAEPLVHAYAAVNADAAAVQVSAGDADPAPPADPHDEADCLLCLAAASHALPLAHTAAAEAPSAPPSLADVQGGSRAPPTFLVPSPRGPPLS